MNITAIIVNFNGGKSIIKCIESLESNLKSYESNIYIIDNASKDNSKDKVISQFQTRVRWTGVEKNLGFSCGIMRAFNSLSKEIKARDDSYLLVLNPDIILNEGCLEKLFEPFDKFENTGLTAPILYNTFGFNLSRGYMFPGFLGLLFEKFLGINCFNMFPQKRLDKSKSLNQKVDWVLGACFLVNVKKFDSIGGMDTKFFLYAEDRDLCLRMKKNNFNIFIVDAGKVVHLEGMSSNWPTEELSKLYHLSSIYFFRKHFREFEVNIIVGFWFLGLLCKIFLDIFFLKCIFFGRSLLEERLLFNIIGIKVILKGFFLRKNYESSLKLDSYNLKTNIEVIIPVRNEEKKIEDCIKSVLWTDRIFIIDSKSIDKTVEISKKYTNDIFTHDFEYSAKQKNWALETLPINSEWVLLIDADERISNKLKREILCTVSKKSTKYSAYTIPRSNYVGNIKIKNGGWHPDRNVRLIKHNSGKFEDRPVHAEFEVIGKTGKLYSPIIHFTRESTIEHLYHMVCYSKIEAKWIYYHGECILEPGFIWFPKHFRKILRKFFKILPQKSVLRFLWYFVFRRGFLDGTRAMILQMIELFYRIWLELYLIEIKQKERSSYNVEIE